MVRLRPYALALCLLIAPCTAAAEFVEVTVDALGSAPADLPGWSGVYWPDYDGDGWPDLHLGGEVLFRNDTTGGFTPVTGIGLDVEHTDAYRASWADADNDGDLDCVQSSAEITTAQTTQRAYYFESEGAPGFQFTRGVYYESPINTATGNPLFVDGDSDGFYEIYQATYGNWAPDYGRAADRYFAADGGEIWTDVTVLHFPQLLITPYERHSLGVVACDWRPQSLTNDIGLFVPVDGLDWSDPSWENILWENDGDGNFTDRAAVWELNVDPHGPYGVGLAAGASWGDYDNDGDFDIVVANDMGWVSLMNNVDVTGDFFNVTEDAGLYTGTDRSWHNTALVDLDNDGDLDLIATAWDEDAAYLYENEGPENLGQFHLATEDFGFDPLAEFAGIDGGVGAADYDRDGDMDLFFTGGVGAAEGKHLFRNDLAPADAANHWLVIELRGDGVSCARTAAGAQLRLAMGGGWSGVKQVENSSADACQHMHAVHFGLGDAEVVDWVEVNWPSPTGIDIEVWSWAEIGAAVDQWITLEQGSGSPITAADAFDRPGELSIEGVYPNPASDRTTCVLNSRGMGATRVTLYDVSGRRVAHETLQVAGRPTPLGLSVRELPAGVYFIKARQGESVASAKLFVLR